MEFPQKTLFVFLLCWFPLLAAPSANAELSTLWTVGEKNHNMEEFEHSNNGRRDLGAGSASGLDDHYYLFGNYPSPIGAVFQNENPKYFEPRLTDVDSRARVYFPPPESDPTISRYTLSFRTIWNGYWLPAQNTSGETSGNHHFIIRCNGIDVSDILIAPYLEDTNNFTVSFSGQALDPRGFNYIEIELLGGTTPEGDPFPSSYWANLDYVSLTAHPTGMLDNDKDGLPLFWESQNLLSDDHFQDANSDWDNDNLSALEEFTIGTSPLNADTDGDGLPDDLEVQSDPLLKDTDRDGLLDGEETVSSPQRADTDGDGASDSLEIVLGTDPSDKQDFPPPYGGSIGINFVHQSDLRSLLHTEAATGVVPQTHWNQTRGLEWSDKTGDQTLIRIPVRGALVDASGTRVPTTMSWTGNNPRLLKNFGEDSDISAHRLYKGALLAISTGGNSEDLIVNFENIPFSNYDLILYLQHDSKFPIAKVTLNDDENISKIFSSLEYEVLNGFKESKAFGDDHFRQGNYLRFRDLGGSELKINLHSDSWLVGLVALQIVDMASDQDGDTIPDSWEREHGLDPSNPEDGISDPDGDQLTNIDEFAQRTDPHEKDSDGDGLTDGVETNNAAFSSLDNTGTDPLNPDTDRDGLSDYYEITNSGFQSDPNNDDSDHDGTPDRTEIQWRTDPLDGDSKVLPIPSYNSINKTLSWSIENLRLRFDYSKGRKLTQNGGGPVVDFRILNGTESEGRYSTINMRLEYNDGALGYAMTLDDVGAFTRAEDNNGFSLAHWSTNRGPIRPNDISQAIGLSGTGIIDYSDRITLRLTATRSSETNNSWTVRFEILNQDTNETVVDLVETNAVAANTILNESAFWNNRRGFPWPDVDIRQSGVSIDFSDRPITEQKLYSAILDTDKDGLTDQFEIENNFDANDRNDGSKDSDGDGLDNRIEQLIGSNPNRADSDGDTIPDDMELVYGSHPNDARSKPFGYSQNTNSSFEDFDGDGRSDVWEFVSRSLPPNGDADLDGFDNAKEITWGTDPWNPLSAPKFSFTPQDDHIEVRWPELLYKDYEFEQSEDLSQLKPLDGTLTGNYRLARLDISDQSIPSSFFQFNLKGDLPNGQGDSDEDGVGSWAENLFGLSPSSGESGRNNNWIDTTGDGNPDTESSGDRLQVQALINDGIQDGKDISELHASRFLSQTTFGPTMEDINYLRSIGYDAWLDEQIDTIQPTHLSDVILDFYNDYHGPRIRNDYLFFEDKAHLPMRNMRTAWGKAALKGPDQLRQRVAFALSQIVVISGRDPNLSNMPVSVAHYYDQLIDKAFGNYYDILEFVTFNSCMGLYLSHAGNQKAQTDLNVFPDENFARELMQLFSVGLWELNPDGSRKLDEDNEPIPTYGQKDITELARVMTGFWFAGRKFGEGGWTDRGGIKPMEIHISKHDFGRKTILGGKIIPAREPSTENALQNVRDAVRMIFEHPNTPVFISKQLIQFLVTDNPSSAYIERVQNVFVDNGRGERGNLEDVVRAILMDKEARNPIYFANVPSSGSLKQPVLRIIHLGRVFKVAENPQFHMWQLEELSDGFYQDPLNAPSVFNFFKPHYEPSGILADQGLSGPVFQILHSYSAISSTQQIWRYLQQGFSTRWNDDSSQPFDYSQFIPLEGNPKALLDRVNLLFCQGMMSSGCRLVILEALDKLDELENLPPGIRTQIVVWITVCSASGATQL